MSEITENAALEMSKVLSHRNKSTQNQLAIESKEIEELLKNNGAKKREWGYPQLLPYTAGSEPMLDVEILIPIDKVIFVYVPYIIKSIFRLRNAIKIRHKGNPALLQNTANELIE